MHSIAEDILTAAVRDFDLDKDGNFIYHSWGNSYRDCTLALWGPMPVATYYKRLRARIDTLLKRGAELKLAVDPDDSNIILGWACAEPPVLHYIYVKEAYRRQGIALTLLNACGLSASVVIPCSHWTPFADQVSARRSSLLRRVDLF